MSEKNSLHTPFSLNAFTDFVKRCQDMPLNMQPLLEMQRKNIQAFNETQKTALETMQEIGNRQKDLFAKIMAQNAELANDLTKETAVENKLSYNAKAIQKSYEQTMESVKDVSALVKKANASTASLLKSRALDNVNSVRSCIKTTQDDAVNS
mgnify:FL=1|tara:strand:- start:195 stop:650 length:456 start_codon:yes stop_codon:yes gene_type:complete